jgi:hypothetical protein
LPGIALGRPFVVGMKELRQLLAQAFVALGLVTAQHGLLEQPLLNLLRQLAPQIERGEAERLREPFDAVVPAHDRKQERFGSRRSTPAGAGHLGGRIAAVVSVGLEKRSGTAQIIVVEMRWWRPKSFDLLALVLALVEQYQCAPCCLQSRPLGLAGQHPGPANRDDPLAFLLLDLVAASLHASLRPSRSLTEP